MATTRNNYLPAICGVLLAAMVSMIGWVVMKTLSHETGLTLVSEKVSNLKEKDDEIRVAIKENTSAIRALTKEIAAKFGVSKNMFNNVSDLRNEINMLRTAVLNALTKSPTN